jgi:GLPGLI family protein
MKSLGYIVLFFFSVMLSDQFVFGQKKVAELSVVYDYVITSGNPSKPMSGFDGATNTIYIKGNMVRSEMTSSLFSSSTIYDSKTGLGVMLKEVSGQKLLIHLSTENWQEINKPDDGIVFTTIPETKTIAGYKCIKAIGKTSYGSELIVYYTTEIIPDNKDYNIKFKNLEGLPLEYQLTYNNRKIQYTVSKVNLNPVPASKFDIPKSGYREMTYEESKKLKPGN